jgi:hypothetical protein
MVMFMITGLWEISVFGVTTKAEGRVPLPTFISADPLCYHHYLVLGSLPLVTLTLGGRHSRADGSDRVREY